MEKRVERIEQTIVRHDEQIASLFSKVDDVNEHLIGIQKSIDQIKYIGIGMVVYFTISEIGFLSGLKMVA